MPNRPNIVYLHSHDTGRYVQPMGHAVPTPHLQRLAEEGVLFRRCFCAAPTCSPSRAALLTGQSAHSSGMLGLAHRGFTLSDHSQHLATTLKQAGYLTVLAGMQHVAKSAQLIGYDVELPHGSRQAKEVSAAAEGFLDSQPRHPFFLDVGYGETHLAFPEMPAEAGRYVRVPDAQPDTPEIRRMTAGFHESARRMDEGHGRVLAALERNGLADDTLVICTTDHGLAYPTMKCNLTDHGMGVFLVIRGPGGFAGGRVVDALVSHIDLFPTLCDLLEIDHPPWLQGTSLGPMIAGDVDAVRDEVFAEVTYHASYEPMRAVRTERWKYIRRFDEDMTTTVLPHCDESAAKKVWIDHGWRDRSVDREQLYDAVFDPNEACNRAGEEEVGTILAEMRNRLHRWMEETGDPLLAGHVAAPKGATINDQRGATPADRPRIVE
jgi:arylsulfatase A-like enzyme